MFGLMRKLKALWVRRGMGFYDLTEDQCCDEGTFFAIQISHEWTLDLPRDLPAFLRALPELFPADSVLVIRSGSKPSSVDGLVEAWRKTLSPEERVKGDEDDSVKLETPVTPENMERIAAMAADVQTEELRFLWVERPTGSSSTDILMDWKQNGLQLGGETKEPRVKAFAEKLSVGYRRFERECGQQSPRWCLDRVRDVPAFLRATVQLVGSGATLSLFGAEFSPDLIKLSGAFLEPYKECDEFSHLHIPLTTGNIDALEPLLTPEFLKSTFINFFIMREGSALLVCTRYGGTDVYLDIPKERIDAFCRELGMKRRRGWRVL